MTARPERGCGSSGPDPRGASGFGKLWLGQSVSLVGTQIGALALPLVAVSYLHVSSAELGFLNALRYLPFLLLALPLGVVVDRGDRRRLMVLADWARALLVAAVPLLYAWDVLAIQVLLVLAFAIGAFQVLFDSACMSFLPQLVSRARLTKANRNLQASQSAAELGGPGLGGAVCAAIGAPAALVVDAVSYVVSAVAVGLVKSPRRPPAPTAPQKRGAGQPWALVWWTEVREGLSFVFRHRELRALALETAVFNTFEQGVLTVYMLYAVRELHLSTLLLGLTLAATGAGSLIGSALAEPASRRFGLGPVITAGSLLGCGAYLLVPAASGGPVLVPVVICAGFSVAGVAIGLSNVLQVSLRQTTTPDRLLGRMTSSYRFVAYGTVPLGALLGGMLAEVAGLRPALWLVAAGLLLAPVAIVCSPLPRRRRLPETATEPTGRSVERGEAL
ncbi:MFS transporter [Streptomyces sp. NPDC018045]|uniref:MFS transporter n=1 Tax=Streptomyces sp. NPDC018045 TaxID=3365037 RepID=UPI0037A7A8FA